MRHIKWSFCLLALLVFALTPPAALALFMGYTGSVGDLDGDGDSGDEDEVMRSAGRCWAARIASDRSFIIDLSGASLSGGTIAQGAVSELTDDDIPARGFLKIDNDGSHVFFIDPSPRDSSEWTVLDPSNPWRLISGPANIDLFSIALHEMGHALGWLCGEESCGWDNPRYEAMMSPAPGDFVSGPLCVSPFPFWDEAALPGCVHLVSGAYDVSLRGDGLGDAVNQLSHVGVSGDLMLGFYGSDNPRETMSPNDVAMFAFAYGDPVNLPPLIDAGPDIVSECNAIGGSNVSLDGSATSDPDGDPLTYSWDCPGVALSGAGDSVATGFFPLDSETTCRLDVEDVFSCPPLADFVWVMVEDTTDPVIVCPSDAVVECTGNNGIDAADPQLAPFFGGVSATDICDASLDIVNNSPTFLPLGDTTVGFTATDGSSNSASCTADVTVLDTIAPTIAVTLDRTQLWPPNHTLATIHADVTVGDVCDPNPTFVLTSITSNEPENGLGDGDAPDDIQNAVPGTPDVEFQLRSERSGRNEGRTYTIVYTAFDGSGNSTSATVEVVVPHDASGFARSGEGFNKTGTDLLPGAKTFDVVIMSSASFDPRTIALPTTQVGSVNGVLPALESRTLDVNNDRLPDLLVTFAAPAANALKALAPGDSLATRYESAESAGYLVKDIFALGSPVRYKK